MDEKPFIELDLCEIDEYIIPELKKLTKISFDVESIINSAEELKYLNQIKKIIASQFFNPDEAFVRYFASKSYDGLLTQKVRDQFSTLTKKALTQFLNDQINERLKTAINNSPSENKSSVTTNSENPESENIIQDKKDGIITTVEEIEGYQIIKAICRSCIDVKRIAQRDTKSYFGVLLDDNNRKPICRLHFNSAQKYIGTFDTEKNETRHPIEEVDDIFKFADHIIKTAKSYLKHHV